MDLTEIVKLSIWEDAGCQIMARITGNSGTPITPNEIDTITCKVFDLNGDTPYSAVATPTIAVASTVFSELQTDARWTRDTTGYNFRHDLPATIFTTGDHKYRIEYLFTPKAGSVFWVVAEVYARAVMSS